MMNHVSATTTTYRPLNLQRLHEGVVQQITAQIMNKTLLPGESLPSEAALAQQLGVSRTVIREAVRVLVGKGLIVVKHGSGMLVQEPDQWNYLDPAILFEQIRLGHDSLLHDLLELRRVVEIELAVLAALRRTPEDLETLHSLLQQMKTVLDDPVAYTRLDIAFHQAIFDAARNRLLTQALRSASQALLVGRLISSQRPGGPAASVRGHEEILEAIEAGDQTQARTVMHKHLVQFEDDVLISLKEGLANNIVNFSVDWI